MKKRILKRVGVVLVILIGVVFIFAKVKRVTPLSWSHNKINVPMFSNQAINGYDPVAYFTENKAVKGSEDNMYNWNDADWYFSSAENKNSFIENPDRYAPQFGGFCSFAVTKGFTANTEPEAFEVINDKLYLFADQDMRESWMSDPEGNMKICTENWK